MRISIILGTCGWLLWGQTVLVNGTGDGSFEGGQAVRLIPTP